MCKERYPFSHPVWGYSSYRDWIWSQVLCQEDLDPPCPIPSIVEDSQIQGGEAEEGGSPVRLSVALGGAVMKSISYGCKSLKGGDNISRNMAHWTQIVTGLGTRWVLTTPRMCLLILFAVNFFSPSFLVLLSWILVLKKGIL